MYKDEQKGNREGRGFQLKGSTDVWRTWGGLCSSGGWAVGAARGCRRTCYGGPVRGTTLLCCKQLPTNSRLLHTKHLATTYEKQHQQQQQLKKPKSTGKEVWQLGNRSPDTCLQESNL